MKFNAGRVKGIKSNLMAKTITITIELPLTEAHEVEADEVARYAKDPDVNVFSVEIVARQMELVK